jgi:hypothetical protein
MPACRKCGADVVPPAAFCGACGARVAGADGPMLRHRVEEIFTHIPHPYILQRKHRAPATVMGSHARDGWMQRFNAYLAVKITEGVGTMWCAYLFALLALISLPQAIRGGTATTIAWIAQTFLQLVLLSIIIVGQKVSAVASDQRALDTYNDAEAVLHEAIQIQQHLAAQDALLTRLVEGRSSGPKAG